MTCYFLCQYQRGIIKRQLPICLLTYTDSAVLNLFYLIQEMSHVIILPLKELNIFAVTDSKQILFVTVYELVFDVQQSLVWEEGQSWFMETLQELVSFKACPVCLTPNPSVRTHADWNTLSAKVWTKTRACQMKCFHRGPKHNSHKSHHPNDVSSQT